MSSKCLHRDALVCTAQIILKEAVGLLGPEGARAVVSGAPGGGAAQVRLALDQLVSHHQQCLHPKRALRCELRWGSFNYLISNSI